MTVNDDGYPRILDRQGCLYGQGIERRINELEEAMERMERQLDKLIGAVTIAAIGLAANAILLALNLLV